MAALLRMEEITKVFSGVPANDAVNLAVEAGEIHALLGENGAGKTTLMNVLYGLYHAEHGSIYIRGERVVISSPRVAISLGIGMVHQHFMLIPALSVAENIVLGMPVPREPLLSQRRIEREIHEVSERYGLAVDPHAIVGDLPVGVRQRVEILKALYRQADLLILDEPTAVLTPGEVDGLFAVLRNLVVQGKSVIFISHKLDEVMRISDRVTVLRDGRVVSTVRTADTDKAELARNMVGREVVLRICRDKSSCGDRAVLALDDVTVQHGREKPRLAHVSFCVQPGEILAIAGVDGNGQRELIEIVSGLRRPTQGSARLLDNDIAHLGVRGLIELGVARIPEDRHALGLVMDFTVQENMIVDSYDRAPNSRHGFLNRRAMHDSAVKLCEQYDVRPRRPELKARLLSGGNQQKVILARELSREPRFILAAQPTRGLDVGATEYVYRCLLDQRARGAAVLLVSTELDEILALADRVAVIYEGRIMGILGREEADVAHIGLLMAGGVQSGEECA